jgi:leucyl aminopeptidase (aminopeptidase T)
MEDRTISKNAENVEVNQDNTQILEERYSLVTERIREVGSDTFEKAELKAYFDSVAAFLQLCDRERSFLKEGGLKEASVEELAAHNHALYADILPDHYEESYANPAFAVHKLGGYGQVLSAIYAKMREIIGFVYEENLEEIVIRMELFDEVYTAFTYEWKENGALPSAESIEEILYWFLSDYSDLFAEEYVSGLVVTEDCFAVKLVMDSDLDDVRYLYAYGEYVSESEIETAKYLSGLPEETIRTMADTYTEGYRKGFELAGIDLSKKTIVGLVYKLGFERMMRRAIENFEKLGLKGVTRRGRGGFAGGAANRQYTYDHKDDLALSLDKNFATRRLEARRTAFEKYKKEARGYAGPAVVETFGEADFNPVNKPEAVRMPEEKNKQWLEMMNGLRQIQRDYIIEEERSFTIIAFPVPEIGPVFEELFDETIRINTLDYMLYRDVQQKLIDVLDTADHCEVKGSGDNRTDLRVNLWKLKDPSEESIFENCVADVNIPVGEVFTSPVLEGTNGLLHVTRVFLNGLEYRNLAITLENGMVKDYTCDNFETEEENRNFIRENILFRHDTLPIGEFAIGTNTTAYVAARKLGVEAKLPILIAEKTGPHFALGDTCYSHSEDVVVHNPDGKEIVAKENERSELRKTKPAEAYFNCHTDITIPYDELGELAAVKKDGTRIVIIKDGRFVLPGTEPLNEAFGS